ncbi:MAG: MarR family winged helix-turn-helix transcriptional regulator [Pseudomonadota bacterium]
MLEEELKEVANNCLLMRTRLIARMITSIYDQELQTLGLNSPQFSLLVVISRLGNANRSEISRFNHQDRSTLTRNIRLIISEGWAQEILGQMSGRSRPLALTDAGNKLLRKAIPAWKKAQVRAEKVLSREGVNTVKSIAKNLQMRTVK